MRTVDCPDCNGTGEVATRRMPYSDEVLRTRVCDTCCGTKTVRVTVELTCGACACVATPAPPDAATPYIQALADVRIDGPAETIGALCPAHRLVFDMAARLGKEMKS